MRPFRNDIVWRCPMCFFIATDVEYQSIKFDAPCRCTRQHFSDFNPVASPISEQKNEEEKP